MVDNAAADVSLGVLGRGLKIVRTLASVHLEMAQAEATREAGRVMEGAVLFACGVMALGAVGLLANAAGVVALAHFTTLGWIWSMALVAVADLLLATTFFGLARRRMRGPVMKETRGLVSRTVTALREA